MKKIFCMRASWFGMMVWISALLSPKVLYSQSACSGTLGPATISKTFGSGPLQYNTLPASAFGFSTSFNLNPTGWTTDGQYSIVNKIGNDFDGVWHEGALDHTNDVDGYMLLVNADRTKGEFYRDTATNLCKGARYEFSAYMTNIHAPAPFFVIPPSAKFEIRDLSGKVLDSISSGEMPVTGSLTWNKYGITFNAPASSVVLVITSTATSGIGNDLALDDIEFKPCIPLTSNSTPSADICENGDAVFTVNLVGNKAFKYGRWQKSIDGINWNYIGTAFTQPFESLNYNFDLYLPNVTIADDNTQYRLILASDLPSLNTPTSICNIVSAISTLKVKPTPNKITITNPTPICNGTVDLTDPAIITGSIYPVGTQFNYFTTFADANNNTNALSIAASKAITKRGTYFIRAFAPNSPACFIIEPIVVEIERSKTLTLNPISDLCKNNALFEVVANQTNVGILTWTNKAGTILQAGPETKLIINPTTAELAKDSIWVYAKSEDLFILGCPNVKDSVKVKFYESQTLELGNPDTILCDPKMYKKLTLNALSVGADSVVWSTSDTRGALPKEGLKTEVPYENIGSFSVIAKAYKKGCKVIDDEKRVLFERYADLKATATLACSPDNRVTVLGDATGNIGLWSTIGTGTFTKPATSLPNIYVPSVADIASGEVKLVFTSTSQNVCPKVDTTIIWKFRPLPIANAGADTTVCTGSTVIRKTTTNAAWTYQWKTAKAGAVLGTNSSYTFNPTQNTTLYVYAKDNDNCAIVDSSEIKVEQKAILTITPTDTCLSNQRVNLVGTSTINNIASTALWSSNGTGTFGASLTTLNSNFYVPSIVDISNGSVKIRLASTGQVVCEAVKDSLNWIIVPFPSANAGIDSVVCINSSITRTIVTNPIWNYKWSQIKNGAIISNSNSVSFNAGNDTNKVYLQVTNANNCTALDSAIITTIKPPVITLAPKICYYAPLSITANVASAPTVGKFDWKKDGISLSNSNKTLLINSTGAYSYTYELDGGCFSNDEIEALEPPTLVVKDTSGCQNGNTAFVANVIPGATYLWGPTEINNGTNKFKINAGNGVSNFKVLVIDQSGCRDSILANITLHPFPDFTLTGSDLCPGQTKKMQALLDNPSLSSAFTVKYQWKDKNKTILGSTISTLDYNSAGKYYAIASIEGCSVIDSIEINKSPNPIIGLQAEYKYCSETDGVLTLQPNAFSEYTWRSDDGLNETSPAISIAPEKSTYYWLRVKNAGGCTDSTQLFVKVVCKPRVFLPNVMTPESNDVNSTLKVFGKHYTNFAITVFSRWGEVIFHSEDPEKTWNGDYLNEKMPLGNYQWQVTYEGDTEEYKGPYKKSGDVTLIR